MLRIIIGGVVSKCVRIAIIVYINSICIVIGGITSQIVPIAITVYTNSMRRIVIGGVIRDSIWVAIPM